MHSFAKLLVILLHSILYCYASVQYFNVETRLSINQLEYWTTLIVLFLLLLIIFSFSLRATCRLSRDIKCSPHYLLLLLLLLLIVQENDCTIKSHFSDYFYSNQKGSIICSYHLKTHAIQILPVISSSTTGIYALLA